MPRQADIAARRFRVVAGILRDAGGRVLVAERIGDTPFAGLWEFPGGKIQDGENRHTALYRELREEIGIDVGSCEYFLSARHDYPDRHVSIDFFLVDEWRHEPRGLEGQQLRWCLPQALAADELLPADAPVLDALRALNAAPPSPAVSKY